MQVKRHQYDTDSDLSAVDPEIKGYRPTCPANISPTGYEPCGEKMRVRKNGDTVCKVHGEMH